MKRERDNENIKNNFFVIFSKKNVKKEGTKLTERE